MGRPTKLDPERTERIVAAIAAGVSRSAAAEAAGIGRSTLMRWLAAARDGDAGYQDFLDLVKKAEADAEVAMVKVVKSAAESGTWQAAAWWLERRRPKHFALKREVRADVTQKVAPMTEQEASDTFISIARDVVTRNPALRAELLAALETK